MSPPLSKSLYLPLLFFIGPRIGQPHQPSFRLADNLLGNDDDVTVVKCLANGAQLFNDQARQIIARLNQWEMGNGKHAD